MKTLLVSLVFFPLVVFSLPKGFVYLDTVAPSIKVDLRYHQSNNFVGRLIIGYEGNRCILTIRAANQLAKVEQTLKRKQLSLKVYDCYRPKRAVEDFYRWSQNRNHKMQQDFYPREVKSELFNRGYIAKYSGHSRGSTVDLTITKAGLKPTPGVRACYLKGRARDASLDMGTNFDCLDKRSHLVSQTISPEAKKNRALLQSVMRKFGFKPYAKEWWHFTLRNEMHPRTYFDFLVR